MKQWFAYNYTAKIAFVERGRKAQSSGLGAFFDSWDEAHAYVAKQASDRLASARVQLAAAQGHAGNVKGMKRPLAAMREADFVEAHGA